MALFSIFIKPPINATQIVKEACKENIFLKTVKYKNQDHLLIAVTEKRTKTQMDDFIEFLKKYQ